jgi:hypothetical protein
MRTGGLVGEELHQQADACAGGDEGVEQKSFFYKRPSVLSRGRSPFTS